MDSLIDKQISGALDTPDVCHHINFNHNDTRKENEVYISNLQHNRIHRRTEALKRRGLPLPMTLEEQLRLTLPTRNDYLVKRQLLRYQVKMKKQGTKTLQAELNELEVLLEALRKELETKTENES